MAHALASFSPGQSAAANRAAPSANGAPLPVDLTAGDAVRLLALLLPRSPGVPTLPDIEVPRDIGHDSRRRMLFKAGVLAAGELGLDAGDFDRDSLIALGRETVADHLTSGASGDVLLALGRLEGAVDDAALAAGDTEKISAQLGAFLHAAFKDEIQLYEALEGLATEPPLLTRKALAAELLRRHGIDPDALMEGGGTVYAYNDITGPTPGLVLNWRAGDYYFNKDTLTADDVRRMRMPGGGMPTEAEAARILGEMPASLDAEFGGRFDAHKQRMADLLAKWLGARLAMHARSAAVDLAGATVTLSRATVRHLKRMKTAVHPYPNYYAYRYGEMPSRGFLVTVHGAGGEHHCFISSRSGAVQVIPPGTSTESWLKREHELVFEDGAVLPPGEPDWRRWRLQVDIQAMASGPQASIHTWLSSMFQAEIERERDAVRGETSTEGGINMLLNLIPLRAMIVALRKGDIPLAIAMGGVDVLTLVPLIGAGFRLAGTVAKSTSPWLGTALRAGARMGGPAVHGLRHMARRIPLLRHRIRAAVSEAAIHGWARLRPLDLRRVAQALRPNAPKLAGILESMAARTRAGAVPDGIWRVGGSATPTAETRNAISPIRMVAAHNTRGDTLALLPYGERAGAYTRVDAAGERIGALLVADSGGWLHQAMPVAAMERHRIASPATLSALDRRRAGPDGTIMLNGSHYASLGSAYVQVREDLAVSTAARRVWRVVAPHGVTPDVIAHRLVHDADEGLWRQAEAPGLAGGYRPCASRSRVCAAPDADEWMTPGDARVARLHDALIAGMRGATRQQVQAMRALLDRIGGDVRGKAILHAMTAHYDLLGRAPEIVIRDATNTALVRPSLAQPEHGAPWHLDLDSLRYATTEQAVQELAAVYNNMTGILQNGDPFLDLFTDGGPRLDPQLEQAWSAWIARGEAGGSRTVVQPDGSTRVYTPREWTVLDLRRQLQELRCYGGLDRSTFKSLLRHAHGRWSAKVDLSRRGLDSVPPLPRDIKVLSLSGNPIRDWSHLPEGLTALYAERTEMTALPARLPPGLTHLDVSRNWLRGAPLSLPAGLLRLDIRQNGLTALPRLPAGLKELVISENNLAVLPEGLPRGLRLLDVSNNMLIRFPADLPEGLKVLLAANNRLAQLSGPLPAGLRELDISANRLQSLPPLPDTLVVLDAHSNMLTSLPDSLPGGLEMFVVSRNRLWRLPDNLPSGLVFLSAQHNAIERLPATITALQGCRIYLDGNPLAPGSIPLIAEGRDGPRIFFQEPGARAHALSRVVWHWWSRPSEDAQARWEAIEHAMGTREEAVQFALFLQRLRETASYRDAGFRAQVEEWLVEISKPERESLLHASLGVCVEASASCDDGIVSVWNDLQVLRRDDDARNGLYDERIEELVGIAREVFRINALNEIARAKERALLDEAARRPDPKPMVDAVEVYLAYLVHLRDALDLKLLAPRMQFYDSSSVTPEDLADARRTVLAREREEFDQFLVLDYAPWQTFLKRRDAQAYTRAEQAARAALDAQFEQALEAEIARLDLPAGDAALLEDARRNLGPGVMRQIRYRAMAPLTRAYV
ncbi:NEL domain-containing protein [Bordetella sputigena]